MLQFEGITATLPRITQYNGSTVFELFLRNYPSDNSFEPGKSNLELCLVCSKSKNMLTYVF